MRGGAGREAQLGNKIVYGGGERRWQRINPSQGGRRGRREGIAATDGRGGEEAALEQQRF